MLIKALKFKGNGSSLWGESKGTFTVNQMDIGYINWVSYRNDKAAPLHASLTLCGPNTEWFHYTDDGVIKGIRGSMTLLRAVRKELARQLTAADISRLLPETITISWSEQGLQPDKGWNFDVSEPRPLTKA